MAHTKAKGTTKLGRDSESKRLGVKIFGGSAVKCGQIIVRQRGTKYLPGNNVRRGGDDTLYATTDGFILFKKINRNGFNGNSKRKQVVSVVDKGPKAVIPNQGKKFIDPQASKTKKAGAKTSLGAPKKEGVGVPTNSLAGKVKKEKK